MNRDSFHGGWPYGQPPNGYPIELNRGSPQARGLGVWCPMSASYGANVLRDIINKTGFTLSNSPVWVGGERGQAVEFGSTTYGYDATNRTETGGFDYTVSMWINGAETQTTGDYQRVCLSLDGFATATREIVLIQRISAYPIYITIIQDGGGTNYAMWNYGSSISNHPANQGGWHHYAYVIRQDTGDCRFFVDGIDQGAPSNDTGNFSEIPLLDGIYLGRYVGATGYLGAGTSKQISDLRIYNRACSVTDIYEQYRNPWDLVLMHRRVWVLAPTSAVGFPWPGPRHPSKNINLRL